jgi:plasmid stabilization system protein ParE
VAKYTLSAEAVADLDTIWEYVARDDVDAADRIVEAAYRVCTNLAKHPELGPLRRFYSSGPGNIRYFVITEFPNYFIFYELLLTVWRSFGFSMGRKTWAICSPKNKVRPATRRSAHL